ncbi:MAG: filamentous hemagglutinin N-terminal domain-containing protein [Deltaproteobacteria bacterium]|nr:filamentous hemagglutinin N-terminal domain-containing protein [Deltaproteobacteria bacterium]
MVPSDRNDNIIRPNPILFCPPRSLARRCLGGSGRGLLRLTWSDVEIRHRTGRYRRYDPRRRTDVGWWRRERQGLHDRGRARSDPRLKRLPQFLAAECPGGGSATFERSAAWGDAVVRNLIARVTGPGQSHLLGALRSTAGESRLVLINPHGLVFGQNFSMDVPGSFFASSADRVENRASGEFYSATDLDGSSFMSLAPDTFRFLDSGAGPIVVKGFLEVRPHYDIALVGGDITVAGDLDSSEPRGIISALDGNISLVSADSAGRVSGLFESSAEISLFGFRSLGDIQIVDDATISSQGLTPVFRLLPPAGSDDVLTPRDSLIVSFFDASGVEQQLADVVIVDSGDAPEAADVLVGMRESTGQQYLLRPRIRGEEGSETSRYSRMTSRSSIRIFAPPLRVAEMAETSRSRRLEDFRSKSGFATTTSDFLPEPV